MTMTTQEPVVSGHGYTIIEVDGRPPAGLADCVGEHLLTLVGNGLSHRVFGTGGREHRPVREAMAHRTPRAGLLSPTDKPVPPMPCESPSVTWFWPVTRPSVVRDQLGDPGALRQVVVIRPLLR
jgi:hypothetical protein